MKELLDVDPQFPSLNFGIGEATSVFILGGGRDY